MHFDCMLLLCLYAFQGESALYSWPNIKELLSWNRRDVWRLSDSNGIRIHNHLICKRTLNNLANMPNGWVLFTN